MRLPKNVTVYIGGKKYTRDIPDDIAPEGISEVKKSGTRHEKKHDKKLEKKDAD